MQPDERLEPTGRPEEAPAWVVAALAVALVMLAPGLALGHGAAHAGPGPDLTPPAVVADPFTADACPVRPTTSRLDGTVAFPEAPLRSIRLCPARTGQPWSEPLDALLDDPNALVRSLRSVVAHASTCPAGSPHQASTAIQVTTLTGRGSTLVGSPCTTVTVSGRDLPFTALETAVRRSIEAQRLVSSPSRYSPGVTCLRPATRMPLSPAVERLVNAASCRRHLPYVLPGGQLAALQRAWSAAPTAAGSRLPTTCRAGSRRPPAPLVLLTDYGDTVRPAWDSCRDRWTVSTADRLVVLPPVGAPPLSDW